MSIDRYNTLVAMFALIAANNGHAQTNATIQSSPRPYTGGLLVVPDSTGKKLGFYVAGTLIGVKDEKPNPHPGPIGPKPPAPSPCGDMECPKPAPPPPPPPACPMPCITFDQRFDGHFLYPIKPVKSFPKTLSPLLETQAILKK